MVGSVGGKKLNVWVSNYSLQYKVEKRVFLEKNQQKVPGFKGTGRRLFWGGVTMLHQVGNGGAGLWRLGRISMG